MENPFEEKEQNTTLGKYALSYGAILGVILVIISLIFYIFNIDSSSYIQYLNYLIIIGYMAYAIIQYRNTMNGGCITYGCSLGCGFLVGMFAAVVTSVYTFIFLQYINPDYITEILAKAEDQMLVQNPNMTQEQIDMGLSYAKMFAKPWLSAITGFVSMSFVSLLFSLLVSIFTQKVDNSKNTSEIR